MDVEPLAVEASRHQSVCEYRNTSSVPSHATTRNVRVRPPGG